MQGSDLVLTSALSSLSAPAALQVLVHFRQSLVRVSSCDFADRLLRSEKSDPRNHTNLHQRSDLHSTSLQTTLHISTPLRTHSVFRNAISAVRSSGVRLTPNSCPFTARVVTPYPRKAVGT